MSGEGEGVLVDADGAEIAYGCRVEQVAVNGEHGAAPSRLGRCGDVVGGLVWAHVRFDGEEHVVAVRADLLRVVRRPAWFLATTGASVVAHRGTLRDLTVHRMCGGVFEPTPRLGRLSVPREYAALGPVCEICAAGVGEVTDR